MMRTTDSASRLTREAEDLLGRALRAIQTHPDQWFQCVWSEGVQRADGSPTARHCLAAWLVIVDRGLDPDQQVRIPRLYEAARVLLGLSDVEATSLFHWCCRDDHRPPTFTELVQRVERVTGFRFDGSKELASVG
jgi:hypothetical protein